MNQPLSQPSASERSDLARFFRWLFSWRGLRRILIVLAWAATILALVYGEENWRGRRAWQKFRHELEARGEQLDLKDFIPKPVPDEQNFAATPLVESWINERASKKFWEDNYSLAATRVVRKPNSEKGRRHLTDLVGWQMAFDALRSGQTGDKPTFTSNQLDREARAKAAPAVLDGLKTSETNLAELRAASRRPYARYPIVYDLDNPWGILLPHLANVKSACVRLQLRACAELASSQTESALEDVRFILYLADTVKDEPFLISYLVRLACLQIGIQPIWEGLAEHRWSEAQLQELQTRLQQCHFITDMKWPFSGERAAGILTVDLVRKNGLGLLVALGGEGSPGPSDLRLADVCGWFIPSGWYYQEQLNYCRLYQAQLSSIFDQTNKRISPQQIKAASHELEREFSGGRLGMKFSAVIHHRVIASLLLPGLAKIPLKAAGAQTTVDQSVLACALERYRLANKQFPEKLDLLVPQFMAHLPNDVLTGEPYKYRRIPEGSFVLYSIGWNEKDEGGALGRMQLDENEGDWVWEQSASASAP